MSIVISPQCKPDINGDTFVELWNDPSFSKWVTSKMTYWNGPTEQDWAWPVPSDLRTIFNDDGFFASKFCRLKPGWHRELTVMMFDQTKPIRCNYKFRLNPGASGFTGIAVLYNGEPNYCGVAANTGIDGEYGTPLYAGVGDPYSLACYDGVSSQLQIPTADGLGVGLIGTVYALEMEWLPNVDLAGNSHPGWATLRVRIDGGEWVGQTSTTQERLRACLGYPASLYLFPGELNLDVGEIRISGSPMWGAEDCWNWADAGWTLDANTMFFSGRDREGMYGEMWGGGITARTSGNQEFGEALYIGGNPVDGRAFTDRSRNIQLRGGHFWDSVRFVVRNPSTHLSIAVYDAADNLLIANLLAVAQQVTAVSTAIVDKFTFACDISGIIAEEIYFVVSGYINAAEVNALKAAQPASPFPAWMYQPILTGIGMDFTYDPDYVEPAAATSAGFELGPLETGTASATGSANRTATGAEITLETGTPTATGSAEQTAAGTELALEAGQASATADASPPVISPGWYLADQQGRMYQLADSQGRAYALQPHA